MKAIMYIQIAGDIILMITLIFLMAKYYSTVKSFSKCTPDANGKKEINNKIRYREAAKLIDEGITGEDISKTLKIPPAEINLIKNLKSL